jgi:Rieske Fe-S protein
LGRANHICDKHRLHGPHSLHHQEKQNPNFFHKQNQEKKAQNSKNNFHKKDLERKPIKISIPNQEPETQQRKDPRFIYIHKRKKKKKHTHTNDTRRIKQNLVCEACSDLGDPSPWNDVKQHLQFRERERERERSRADQEERV